MNSRVLKGLIMYYAKPSIVVRNLFFAILFSLITFSSDAMEPLPYRLFPALYRKENISRIDQNMSLANYQSSGGFLWERVPIVANNTILAYYGSPLSDKMGILGLYQKEKIAEMLKEMAAQYDQVNGKDGVIPAFYIIYGTCWPGGEIGYLDDKILLDYIRFAQSMGMLVFIDHQIGKYSLRAAMDKILPFLRYPNVHLAIDPEWRTLSPMKEIGSITASELNDAQNYMDEYIRANDIPGIRMLVVHQFADKMIQSREEVISHRDRVILIHTADGFGAPRLKKATYQRNADAENMPVKGFKLFFKSDFALAGFDMPLMSPSEVMQLDPRPSLIIYQ
ncbi:MAG TPA: hypothetical protein PLE76_06295 [Rectinema sp.]|nr:hypothetical protein [Spirochaetia bacterium]MDI9426970.1 hypothetical protein [Spirochaetota bacterium]NLH89208.1 hypothetical protein [Treponema sp.]HNP92526.1 hypothetical protein [Rectinema sp.]HNT58828.1 hypothetical protein [Rectinema sp.]